MNPYANTKLTANAKALRKHMTREERHLRFDFLKTLPVMATGKRWTEGPDVVANSSFSPEAGEVRTLYCIPHQSAST